MVFPFGLQDSELSKETAVEAQRLAAECRQQHQPLALGSEFAASFGVQCRECTRKWFICYWWEVGASHIPALIFRPLKSDTPPAGAHRPTTL